MEGSSICKFVMHLPYEYDINRLAGLGIVKLAVLKNKIVPHMAKVDIWIFQTKNEYIATSLSK